MKAVMTSASVMLGIEFLISKKHRMLGAWPSTCSHIIVGEDFFRLFPGFDGVRGKASELVHYGWREHDGKIICHDTGVSSGDIDSSGVSL